MLPTARAGKYVLSDLTTDCETLDRCLYETGVVQTRDGEPLDAPPLAWLTISYGSRSISPPPTLSFIQDN